MLKKFALLALLSLPLCGISEASPVTIDFESATPVGGTNVGTGGTVNGFTLTPNNGGPYSGGFNTPWAATPTAKSGQVFMNNWNSRIGALTKDSGLFTLNSVWAHADARFGSTTIRFQGLDGLGGSVLHSIDVVVGTSWQLISFSNWTNVKTFTWDSLIPNSSNIGIDDFTYSEPSAVVPLPAALPLLAGGLGVLGLMGWRRKKAA